MVKFDFVGNVGCTTVIFTVSGFKNYYSAQSIDATFNAGTTSVGSSAYMTQPIVATDT